MIVTTPEIRTTLLLIPGGRDLSLPQNATKFKTSLQHAVLNKTAQIIMLADTPIVPEETVQQKYDFKTVLLIESDGIASVDDVWTFANQLLDGHLPLLCEAGFDYQVTKMEPVKVQYEDFERLAKFL